jgi:hypothetical protein
VRANETRREPNERVGMLSIKLFVSTVHTITMPQTTCLGDTVPRSLSSLPRMSPFRCGRSTKPLFMALAESDRSCSLPWKTVEVYGPIVVLAIPNLNGDAKRLATCRWENRHVTWSQASEDFAPDGSVRDIYVRHVRAEDWEIAYHWLLDTYRHEFTRDGIPIDPPPSVESIWRDRAVAFSHLTRHK